MIEQDLFREPQTTTVPPAGLYYAARASGWSFGAHAGGAVVDPGEILPYAPDQPLTPLILSRCLLPLPKGAEPVACDCGRRFLNAESLRVHRCRSHGEQ